jgi:hypothetical protein
VRDVTNASHMPFRIRPGAPTSSIDIAASGNVGFGTASPTLVSGTSNKVLVVSGSTNPMVAITNTTANRQWGWYVDPSGSLAAFDATATADRFHIATNGNVGIGMPSPTAQLHTTGSVTFAGITGCSGGLQTAGGGQVSCLVSSRQFKNITGDLAPDVALANVMALRPQVGSYKTTPDIPEHWLIAEDVAAVDPALAGFKDGAPYTIKTQNLVADLVVVVQRQQREIEELRRLIGK